MASDLEKLANELQKAIDEDARNTYTEEVIQHSSHPKNLGRMNDPDGSASIKGLCGDTMEIYLTITSETIIDARFYTDGCGVTLACGSVATELVKGKSISDVLMISPADIIYALKKLPEENLHCAILSVSTLHKALADYLLRRLTY
jgi:nitrogen fixation NifU-like protein